MLRLPTLSAVLSCLAVLAGGGVFTALLYRAQLGVDFTDECFYASLTNRLTQGATLFVDEFALQQLAALLIVPLTWVHRSVTGSTEGLILFLRWSYLATTLILSLCTTMALKKNWGFAAAFLIGFIGVAYIPFNIIAFSYNTLGIQLFAAGLFLGFHAHASQSPSRHSWIFLAGFLFGANLLAYPPLVVPQAVFLLIFVCLTQSWRALASFVAGWAIVPLLLLGLLREEGIANFHQSMSFCTPNVFGVSKLFDVWTGLWNMHPYKKLALGGLMLLLPVLWFARRYFSPLSLIAIAMLLVPFPLSADPLRDTMAYVIFFSFTALVSIVFLWKDAVARNLFLLVWIPSLVGGYLTAFASNNGAINMAIGIFPAMVAAVCLLLMLIRQGAQSADGETAEFTTIDSLSHFAVPLTIVSLFTVLTYSSSYRDFRPLDLHARVEQGPFAGLYTTPERVALIRDMTTSLNSVARPGERVLFFYNFPAGYLLADLPCASNCSWQNKCDAPYWIGHHRAIEYYWKDPDHQPAVVVQITTYLSDYPHIANKAYSLDSSDPFADLLQKQFTLIVEHQHFRIYRRDPHSPSMIELKAPSWKTAP